MENLLSIIQIIVAILLIIFILVQQRGTALGSAFGGGGGGGGGQGFYATKRGIQQKIYWASIILGILFISLTLMSLIIK